MAGNTYHKLWRRERCIDVILCAAAVLSVVTFVAGMRSPLTACSQYLVEYGHLYN